MPRTRCFATSAASSPCPGWTLRSPDPVIWEAGVRAWANLYPWDVDGDPAAAGRLAGLGLAGVTLAAAYHAVRAVTPFHPEHRIVTRDVTLHRRGRTAEHRVKERRERREE